MLPKHSIWSLAVPLVLLTLAASSSAKPHKPAPQQSKVEILAPQPGTCLQGMVEVRIKVTPVKQGRIPSSMYVGLGGPPFTALKRDEKTDEWIGKVDSSMVPNGPVQLVVVGWAPSEKRLSATAAVTAQNPLKCYFADLHAHTSYSDGTLFPSDAYAHAQKVAKLDVFSLTDHLESVDEAEWADMREQAWKANQEGKFITIPGLEWTKAQGHIVILDPGTRLWPTKTKDFYEAAAKAGVIAKFNHPGDGTKVFDGLAYSEDGDKAIELMEVRNPDEEKAYLRALKLGWHLAPDGSDDTHTPNWGEKRAWTGILAPGLSRRNIWAALKARHCYSTLDRNCRLSFEVNGAVMGDIIEKPVQDVNVTVAVDDPDATDKTSKIELFEDGAIIQTDQPYSSQRAWKTTCSPAPGKHYYLVKVTQADGNMLWSAPVWVTVAAK